MKPKPKHRTKPAPPCESVKIVVHNDMKFLTHWVYLFEAVVTTAEQLLPTDEAAAKRLYQQAAAFQRQFEIQHKLFD